MTRLQRARRALARATARATARVRRAPRPLDASDVVAIVGVAMVAVGLGMFHPALPWLLVGAYLVRVSSALTAPRAR